MKYGPDKERSGNAVMLMAVTFVILGGVGVFVALSGVSPIDPLVSLAVIGVLFLVWGIIFWTLNKMAAASALNATFFRFWKKDLDANRLDWEPKKVRNYRKKDLGTNAPPTKESLEDLGMGNSTWVPKGNAPKRKTTPSQKSPRRH
ncbi:MAG: hypothetical protein CMJ46_07195 [Planctomyces sp.]|nr:hypothetical protein [Planctomyces sp.]